MKKRGFARVRRSRSRLLAAVALVGDAPAASARTTPKSRSRRSSPSSPGGGTDIAARVILKAAEKYFGGTFVVDNRPGAGGAIGFTAIATAPKDGYTIGMINPPTVLLNPIQLGDKVKYKLEDFYPIANFVSDPGAWSAAPTAPSRPCTTSSTPRRRTRTRSASATAAPAPRRP